MDEEQNIKVIKEILDLIYSDLKFRLYDKNKISPFFERNLEITKSVLVDKKTKVSQAKIHDLSAPRIAQIIRKTLKMCFRYVDNRARMERDLDASCLPAYWQPLFPDKVRNI